MSSAPWRLQTRPYVHAEFPGEEIWVTVGATFAADVRGLVPDADCARFWARFWDDFADRLEDVLEASLGTGLEAGLEPARQIAARMLAERFAERAAA